MTREHILEIIRQWNHHWTYEQPGYQPRVCDANMAHDLADRLLHVSRDEVLRLRALEGEKTEGEE